MNLKDVVLDLIEYDEETTLNHYIDASFSMYSFWVNKQCFHGQNSMNGVVAFQIDTVYMPQAFQIRLN